MQINSDDIIDDMIRNYAKPWTATLVLYFVAGDDGVDSDTAGESSLLKTLKNGPFIEIKE